MNVLNRARILGSSALMALAAMAGMGMGTTANGSVSNAQVGNELKQLKDSQKPKSSSVAQSISDAMVRRLMGKGMSAYKHSYPNGPGSTQAQVQRMARKKKNQAKNKRNHRG